jgi:hypothetical protein
MTLFELIDELQGLANAETVDMQVYLSESRCDEKLEREGPTKISSISRMDHALVGEGWIIE